MNKLTKSIIALIDAGLDEGAEVILDNKKEIKEIKSLLNGNIQQALLDLEKPIRERYSVILDEYEKERQQRISYGDS